MRWRFVSWVFCVPGVLGPYSVSGIAELLKKTETDSTCFFHCCQILCYSMHWELRLEWVGSITQAVRLTLMKVLMALLPIPLTVTLLMNLVCIVILLELYVHNFDS